MATNDNQSLKKYTDELRSIAKINKLVIFVGSGVSKNIPNMPSWQDLIKELANSIGYSRCSNCRKKDDCVDKDLSVNNCKLAYDYSADELLKIPQYVYNNDPVLYQEKIKEQISDCIIPEFPVTKKIFEINPDHIITTNYDRLIESSSSEYRNQYDIIVRDKDLLNSEKSKYIIKMHGDILKPDTIVLKEQDYLEYSQNHVVIELFIKALLTDHIFLFLGYSLVDYNVKQIISWINYLRSNNNISKNIGYIVLDSEDIDCNIVEYFRKNNIKVLNIHNFTLIKDIPNELTDEKGKRLYSFLSLIVDQTLIRDINPSDSFAESAEIVISNKINDYSIVLSILGIKQYVKKENALVLYDKNAEETFKQFINYCNGNNTKADNFKQCLINVGIRTIEYNDEKNRHAFTIDSKILRELDQDELYSLYLQNKYSEVISCSRKEKNTLKRSFYNFLVSEDLSIYGEYNKIVFKDLSNKEKVAFLHNKATLKALQTYKYDSSKVKNYIKNIASEEEKQLYQFYLDMYEGNSEKKYKMLTSLNKLKENINSNSTYFFEGYSYGELYNIKNVALTYYDLNFNNFLLMPINMSDTREFFKTYIEAILCANADKVIKTVDVGGFKVDYDKYPIDEIDIDILTKYISAKDLNKLLNTYKITYFRMDRKTTDHIIACLENIIRSIICGKVNDRKEIQLSIFTNLSLLLSRTILEEKDKKAISIAIRELFIDKKFHNRFWNILFPDIHICLKAFVLLFEKINFSMECNCLPYIINSPGFKEVLRNRFTEVKEIIKHLINDGNINESELYVFIEGDEKNKILLLELLHNWIKDEKKRKEYSSYLSDNFSKMSSNACYTFVFNGWISLDEKKKQGLLNDIIELYHSKNPLIHTYPDQLERKLEEVYIFYISGIMEDISSLEELSKDYVHLDFLLHPNEFDYTKVDFSNYMWNNFANHENLMKHFIDNKDEIIPLIEEKIRNESASEFERKILYGCLIQKDKLFVSN